MNSHRPKRGMMMIIALALLIPVCTGCDLLRGSDAEAVTPLDLSEPFTGRIFPIAGNPHVAEIYSARSQQGEVVDTVLITPFFIPAEDSTDRPEIIATYVQVRCDTLEVRARAQSFHSPLGVMTNGPVMLDNSAYRSEGYQTLISSICDERDVDGVEISDLGSYLRAISSR